MVSLHNIHLRWIIIEKSEEEEKNKIVAEKSGFDVEQSVAKLLSQWDRCQAGEHWADIVIKMCKGEPKGEPVKKQMTGIIP